ncbi:cyclase [Pseudarthrobacter psychrotolerans]|uniref:Cyclase n=1 Tax=Pseudarthrobacter psychrotolerans TaxID=2697569 RepID=A0A6P1NJ66_9MICC|nr:SRPBCC family protein [Pseudarthrobacter psychrotolerans]QHK20675.1 cyclase [Pseudarthrobacter psychrotolerans]
MSSKVEKRIVVDVPVSTAYNQWTQFEDFPHFMGGVESVTQLSDDRLKWVAHIAGVRRHWEARIVEQIPDRRVAWASTEGATNSGTVEFSDAGGNKTQLSLTLEYQPEGMVEKVGDLLHVVARQAEHDLKKFKDFIEHEGHATGAWRESVPGATGAASATTSDATTSSTAESVTGDVRPADNRFAHPFDQTGGLVDLEGESDGSAEGEIHSRGERRAPKPGGGTTPPLGGTLGDR